MADLPAESDLIEIGGDWAGRPSGKDIVCRFHDGEPGAQREAERDRTSQNVPVGTAIGAIEIGPKESKRYCPKIEGSTNKCEQRELTLEDRRLAPELRGPDVQARRRFEDMRKRRTEAECGSKK